MFQKVERLGGNNLWPRIILYKFRHDPLPGDQGIDLKQGGYDYYAVLVPTTNAGLLRAELQSISGNPNLYLRVGAAPTLNHYAQEQTRK